MNTHGYKILDSKYNACGQTNNRPNVLAQRVNEHLALGYSLIGVPYTDGTFHYQAVAK